MLKKTAFTPRAVVYATLVHAALIALLVVSLDWTPKPKPAQPEVDTIKATVVDTSQLQAAHEERRQAEQSKRQEQEDRRKRLDEEKRAVEQQREKEQRIKEREQKQAEELAQHKKLEIEHQEKLKKQQQADELSLKKKLEVEKLKKEQEASRLAKTKKEEEKHRRDTEERALQEQLDAEQQRQNADKERQAKAAEGKYQGLIQQKVKRNWLRPQNARDGLKCMVLVRLAPSGEVLVARVTQSSGDVAFDRSAEAAVYKASPLPVPQDASLFEERFREFNFVFRPEG